MNFLKVKNFDTYQHYKDRERLHWIKLQIKILDDFDIDQLDDVSKGHIVFIWLLAAKLNNKIPFDADWIQKKIGSKVKPKIEMFIERGFLLLHEESEGDLSNFVPNGTESHEVMLLRIEEEKKKKKKRIEQIHVIFEYWQTVTGHSRALLDKKRTRSIEKALELGYSVEDLKQAIDGNFASDFHQARGKNNGGTVYDQITLIMRDAEHIEKFMAMKSNSSVDLYEEAFAS